MESKSSIAKDGGWLSRKLWFCFVSSVLVLVASRISPAAGLSEVVTGLVMICGIFVTGNAVVRWKAGNIEQAKTESAVPAKETKLKSEEDMRG
jgi:hypothetical protein